MSGIAGIIHFDGRPVEPVQVEAMTAAMHYRGPDGINHWRRGNVALGQCMLRTTPESLEETQPLTNEDESLVLVMDGRVDNWEELRRELMGKGAVLRTRADAELVLRAYEVWSDECLSHIDGDFALVIWDDRRQEAFCARDRIGNKPFHYHWSGKTLTFASELHPILALPWVEQKPNEGMLAEFLAWDVRSKNETMWAQIFRLAPAHHMVVTGKRAQPRQYWLPDFGARLTFNRDEEYFDCYRELLTDSVRRLSRTHRPLACEVSGGLDSSALFCVADHLRKRGQLPAPGLEGYTLAFTDQTEANEVEYARAVGKYLGVRIHEIFPLRMPLAWYEETAREYRDCVGFPNGATSTNLFHQASIDGSRVLLNGVGGDEWLGGARTYYAEELSRLHMIEIYRSLKSDVAAYGIGQTAAWFLRYGLFSLLPNALQSRLKSGVRWLLRRETISPYWLTPQMQRLLVDRTSHGLSHHFIQPRTIGQQRLLEILDNGFRVGGSEMTERLIARSQLEVRRPFHAVSLIQFAFSTPERLRLSGGINKYIHVQALKNLVPSQVLERQSKAEFSSLFSAHLDEMSLTLIQTIPQRKPEWLSAEGIRKLHDTYKGRPQGWPLWVLWSIYMCNNVR